MKWITWRRWMLAPLMAVLVMGGAFAIAPPAHAASNVYTVTDCASQNDPSTGGFGWAVNQANANVGSTILFSCAQNASPNIIDVASTITFTLSVTIDGSGQNIVFDGGNSTMIFDFYPSNNLTGVTVIRNLTLQHGVPAIKVESGAIQISNSLFAGNSNGAIVDGSGGLAMVDRSAFVSNTSSGYGGAISTTSSNSDLLISNSTFANNRAGQMGGAVLVSGSAEITASTFTGNSAPSGNDLANYVHSGPTSLTDSIVPNGVYSDGGPISFTGTLTSATFAAPLTRVIRGVQQTVYPLASYTVAGAQATLASMTTGDANGGIPTPPTDQLGDLRQATTVVGAYDPNALLRMSSTGNQRVTLTGGTISETTGNLTALSVTANGFDQTVTGTLPVTVTDATGSGAGWHLTIQRTVFMNGSTPAPTITATLTGIAGACSTGSTCTVAANAITGYPIAIPTASPVVFSDATANTGMGQMLDSAGFSIAIPANVFAATYQSTLTVAVVSGP